MHRNGHYGAALLGYAPLGLVTLAAGFEVAGVGGAVVSVGLAMVPDWDMRLPNVAHRGPTHTVRFALGVGAVMGVAGAVSLYLLGHGPLLSAGVATFGVAVGTTAILSHIGADALTPMGVEPLGDGRTYSLEVCRADSLFGNYGLLILGFIAALLSYWVGQGVHVFLSGY
jgi:inner membrane protein